MRMSFLSPLIVAGLSLALACSNSGSGNASGQGGTPSDSTSSTSVVQAVVGGSEDSPLINQSTLVTTGASVTLDGTATSASSVQPGVVLTGCTTADGMPSGEGPFYMKQIHLHSSFIGPITALDTAAGSLTVMGQTILVDSLTHYAQANEDGSHTSLTLADFAVSDFVTVFGFFKSDDSFLATRVERAYAGADTTLCGISGTISGLDTTAMTFTVGSWTVSYASATVNGTLANDASVQVRGTVADTTLTATLVNVAKALGDPGCHGGLRGIVESLDTTALTFQVMGITVKYTTDIVVGTLANGVMVEVQGSFETDSTTVLDATRVVVTIKPSGRDDHRCDAQVKGAITALDLTAMTLTVADTTFWFDASTTLLSHDATITASDLAIGDWVAIVADSTKADANGCSYATRIVVIPSAPSDNEEPQQRLMGPVSSFDATAQTLVIDTFTVSVTTDTTYVSQGATITAETFWSSLAEGTMVEAIGSTSSETAFTATKLILGCQDGMGRKRH